MPKVLKNPFAKHRKGPPAWAAKARSRTQPAPKSATKNRWARSNDWIRKWEDIVEKSKKISKKDQKIWDLLSDGQSVTMPKPKRKAKKARVAPVPIVMTNDFALAVRKYTDAVQANWLAYAGTKSSALTFEFEFGKKYLRIYSRTPSSVVRSIHTFIVLNDDPNTAFLRGDILKAASFNQPATNFARGNIFDENYTANWTGAS